MLAAATDSVKAAPVIQNTCTTLASSSSTEDGSDLRRNIQSVIFKNAQGVTVAEGKFLTFAESSPNEVM